MPAPATNRRSSLHAASLCVLIAAALAFALACTGSVNHQRPGPKSIASAHRADAHPYRAEQARPRVLSHLACVLAITRGSAPAAVSRDLRAASDRPRSLDPVHIETGRSPPAFS